MLASTSFFIQYSAVKTSECGIGYYLWEYEHLVKLTDLLFQYAGFEISPTFPSYLLSLCYRYWTIHHCLVIIVAMFILT